MILASLGNPSSFLAAPRIRYSSILLFQILMRLRVSLHFDCILNSSLVPKLVYCVCNFLFALPQWDSFGSTCVVKLWQEGLPRIIYRILVEIVPCVQWNENDGNSGVLGPKLYN